MKQLRIVLVRSLCAAAVLGAPIASNVALADAKVPEHAVAHARVHLSDVIDSAPDALRDVDLGPAPLAGSSRLLHKAEIVSALPADAGVMKLPEVVRITRKTKSLSAAELEKLTKDAVASSTLPRGAVLTAARPKGPATIPDGYDAVTASIAKLPRKAGKVTGSVILTFRESDIDVGAVTVPADFTLPAAASAPDLKKNGHATLVIRRGSIEIRAVVVANADADVGDEIMVTVADSNHTLRGRLVESDPATLEETR
jgi:hypothetical protein